MFKKKKIMKKTYINPELKVVLVQQQSHLLAGSGQKMNVNSGSASEWGSRQSSSDWDDDDE